MTIRKNAWEQFTVLENELVQLTFSNKGGRVSKALLKEYKDQKKHPDAILLFRCGDFYETYKDDAVRQLPL